MHKNDYSCIVYFENTNPKKWAFVHKLNGFASFLNEKHKGWKYFNVYERRTAKFLKRFYPGNIIPDFIASLLLIFLLRCLPFHGLPVPLNSTFGSSPLTFNNFFSNSATIPTNGRGVLCLG